MRLINDLGHHPSLDCRRLRSVEARRFLGVESRGRRMRPTLSRLSSTFCCSFELLGQMVIVKSVVLSLG